MEDPKKKKRTRRVVEVAAFLKRTSMSRFMERRVSLTRKMRRRTPRTMTGSRLTARSSSTMITTTIRGAPELLAHPNSVWRTLDPTTRWPRTKKTPAFTHSCRRATLGASHRLASLPTSPSLHTMFCLGRAHPKPDERAYTPHNCVIESS